MTLTLSPRHLSRDSLTEFLKSGAPAVVRIDGVPELFLTIDPAGPRLGLRVPWTGRALPDLSSYRNIDASSIYWRDSRWNELRIEGSSVVDAYPALCAMADLVQVESVDFGRAIRDALHAYRELLAGFGRLSSEQEIGLYGELAMLRGLVGVVPAGRAVAAWRGPIGEEHDFDLGDCDLEVKTTSTEERRHWINHVSQLEPTVGRPLYLLSLQLTETGDEGTSLAELVDLVRSSIGDAEVRHALQSKLAAVGWSEESAALYRRKFRMRSDPMAFEVTDDFPAITPARLTASGLDHSRIVRISYVIDLSGLPIATPAPELLASAISGALA